MSPGWKRILVGILFSAGCLQQGPEPRGRLLFRGQNLESPTFITVEDVETVRFEERTAYATATMSGASDVWISSFDGSVQRKIVSNRSSHWGDDADSSGTYYMVDEHLVPSGGGKVRTATLLRLGPTLEEEFRLERIATYRRVWVSMRALVENPAEGQPCPGFPRLKDNCPQLLYERPAEAGEPYPTLMLWDGRDHIPLGPDSNGFQVQTIGDTAYFVLDDQHRLTRFLRPGYALETIREKVGRFTISGDERYAALSVRDDKARTVIRELKTGKEIELMRPNPSIWGGFSGSTFYYTQNATTSSPAEIHRLNLETGEDKYDTLPSPLADLSGAPERPSSPGRPDERLLLDSSGHGVFTARDDLVAKRVLEGPLYTPAFTGDGKYVVYVKPAAPTLYDPSVQGPLMFQDADKTDEPPVMVSPPGLLVGTKRGAAYFFTSGDNGPILVFWAHLGRSSSDLYFADYTDGAVPTNLRLIARSILSVSVSAHTLFGILNMSQQDGVGDLVRRNLDTGTELLYAQAVVDVGTCPEHHDCDGKFLYLVRGRESSDRSGLWITDFDQLAPDGGRN